MKLLPITPAKSLNKAYLKQSIKREQIELFKANLVRLFERIRVEEHEEHLKNLVADFLKDTWYKPAFEINTSKRTDLVIHTGKSSDDPIAVIIEAKKPSNRAEMITPERPNAKALHELLHYYMQERYIRDNKEIKHLIICNIYEWYIFDAADFERFFFGNHKLVKSYKDWNDGLLVSANTDWFYQEIAKPFIEKELIELPCVCFDLHDFEKIVRTPPLSPPKLGGDQRGGDDKKLINLYKLLSPPHLLKQPFANDSNSLNKEFYSELLHIIGLEEVKEKGKKLIRRKAEGERQEGSLLENSIDVLRRRNKVVVEQAVSESPLQNDDIYFEPALELCITWLNRLLFLKLLEGQLIAYHKGDRAYTFLNNNRIEDFDELNELFFEVLAVRIDERSPSVQAKFGNIPYLNSSLFEESDLERATIRINELKNRHDLPLYGATVLKGGTGKRLTGNKNTLSYLFEFLDAYDFSTEGSAEIQEQNKTIINASVLGLIFEKINGYKDGSFFTPGFITMYICRETIHRALLRKFNERYDWSCHDFIELYNNLDKISIKEANETVNSLKICDPAVGSGHFLVSALNEIIAVKSDLGILADKDGKRLREFAVSVENDELIVTHDEHLYTYNFKDPESQRVQETLFHEKETIIENCLFGVDINAKSVAICRLRLWIELLKNAYYRRGTDELETLPNIDINIKCGNSLVSRFALEGKANVYATERHKLKAITDRYREKVWFYKKAPANKAILRKEIASLKEELQQYAVPTDPELLAFRTLKNELDQLGFGFSQEDMEKRRESMAREDDLKQRIDEKQRTFYANAFEWRFEFPEVLDENGEFVGFDAVIGNPPYGLRISSQLVSLQNVFTPARKISDSYCLFMLKGIELAKIAGLLSYIVPNTFCDLESGEDYRQFILTNFKLVEIMETGFIFDSAVVNTVVTMFEKTSYAIPYDIKVLVGNDRYSRNVASFIASEKCKIDYRNKVKYEFIDEINNKSAQLGRIATVKAGVKLYEKGKGEPPQDKITLETRPYTTNGSPPVGWRPLYRGTDIDRYMLALPSEYVNYGPWLAAPRSADLFTSPKIIMRRTDDRLFSTIEYDSAICVNSCHVIKLLEECANEYDYKYILGILNSKLSQFIFEKNNPQMVGKTFSEIKVVYVERLPIISVSHQQQAPIIERVQKILADPDSSEVPCLEAEIDRLVYALYGLTDEEIKLVEGKK